MNLYVLIINFNGPTKLGTLNQVKLEITSKGAPLGNAVKVVDGILPTPLDVMLLGSMILALSPCQLNMNTGSCQGILLVLQL